MCCEAVDGNSGNWESSGDREELISSLDPDTARARTDDEREESATARWFEPVGASTRCVLEPVEFPLKGINPGIDWIGRKKGNGYPIEGLTEVTAFARDLLDKYREVAIAESRASFKVSWLLFCDKLDGKGLLLPDASELITLGGRDADDWITLESF